MRDPATGSSSRGLWVKSIPVLLLLSLVLCPPCIGGGEEADAEGLALAKAAVERFQQKDYEGAARAYLAAIESLAEPYAEEEQNQARSIALLRERADASSDVLASEIRELLSRQDLTSARLAEFELGLARSYARLARPLEACRAVGRALGNDLRLLDRVREDEHLEPIREHHDYDELMFRATLGRGHLDTGDPVEYEHADRSHRRRLRLGPGDADLAAKSGVVRALGNLASARADAEAPEHLAFSNYDRLTRLALLRPSTHGGWPYRHAHLFDGGAAIESLQAECQRRFEERRKNRDGPFRAFVAFFPAVHLGKTDLVRSHLDYLRENSPYLHDHALDGLKWVLKAYLDNRSALPGTTRATSRTLLKEAQKQYDAGDLPVTRLLAWLGRPDTMVRYGQFYLRGMRGLGKDPVRAVCWFHGAAAQGNATATILLSQCYMDGNGVDKDEERAFGLCLASAEEGEVASLNLLGYYYQYGKGVEIDYGRARDLFERAANKGNPYSMESLGLLIHRGQGGSQDYEAAKRWYHKAHDAGNPRGLRRLGNLAIDARESASGLAQAGDLLTRALKATPDDQLALLYLWASLQLRDRAEEAQRLAKSFHAEMEEDSLERELILGMTRRKIETSKLLRKAKKEKDEEIRIRVTGHIYFLAGIQALAGGGESRARKSFKSCVKHGQDADSVRYTAMSELRRLE